ncbi:hypothetical protein DPMN_137570 [Dreissena polymorpha]|uniref:Uncharacterized protein n=1 Tax=Dreissena polymorpha TaxID=45954 RepID=A0A9D4JGI6_DREPO|nr:hypothetical protein DPMN_137570 [Dreissena polymorpha]
MMNMPKILPSIEISHSTKNMRGMKLCKHIIIIIVIIIIIFPSPSQISEEQTFYASFMKTGPNMNDFKSVNQIPIQT